MITVSLWLIGTHDQRFITTVPVFEAVNFPGDAKDWTVKGNFDSAIVSADGIFIDNSAGNTSEIETFIFQKFPLQQNTGGGVSAEKKYRILKLNSVVEVIEKEKSNSTSLPKKRQAALMVWLYDSNDIAKRYTTLESFSGKNADYFAIERTIEISDEIHTVALAFMVRDSRATFHIKSAFASFVVKNQAFAVLAYIFWAIYFVMLICCILMLVASIRKYSSAISSSVSIISILLVTFLTIYGVVVPDSVRSEFFNSVAASLDTINVLSRLGLSGNVLIFKTGHVLMFLLGSFGLFLIGRKAGYSFRCLLLYLIVFALSTEVMQTYRIDRETRISDFGLDFIGILLGLFTYIGLRKGFYLAQQNT